MVAFAKAHWAKLAAFLAGWTAEAQVELSTHLQALLDFIKSSF